MRHVVSVMRPTKNRDGFGQVQGEPETIIGRWPCSIETLSGRELELARTTFASATLKVQGYGDPKKPLQFDDYLLFGIRKLHIGGIIDKNQNGVELTLLCGEQT